MLASAAAVSAHPLGNFTVNHLTYVEISRDRVELLYVLDQAEIPTFREKQQGNLEEGERPRLGARISFPPGQAGLKTTRVEIPLVARVGTPRAVRLRDFTYDVYVDIVPRPGRGTTVRTTVSRADPTGGLRT